MFSFSNSHVDVEVQGEDVPRWCLTSFYGNPNRSKWRESWQLLRTIHANTTLPWLDSGDFNELLTPRNKQGGVIHPSILMENFKVAVSDCSLVELHMEGRRFTWEKGQGTTRWLQEKFDHALVSTTWLRCNPTTRVINTSTVGSDHTTLIIIL